jgi:ubiquinol-cytochrome c reductase cytochrome b subunit
VFLLPGALIAFVVAHLYLMRRHGISGALKPVEGPSKPFYPYYAFKDTIASAVVFALLLTFATLWRPPLDAIADQTDANYIPRPEWYFLSLFQLLKYFPGPLEPLATMVIPGLVVGLLFLLPFLDSRPDRHPAQRPLVTGGFAVIGAGIIVLTYLGYKDTPAHADPSRWTPLAIAGREIAKNERCLSCHREGGAANPIAQTRLAHDPEWLLSHVRDPEIIAPGLRQPPTGAGLGPSSAMAIVAYMRKVRAGGPDPMVTSDELAASVVFGTYCASCHMIDGEGGSSAPDLTRAGATRDAQWLRDWIADPTAVDPFANMPPFGGVLSEQQMDAIVNHLAARK